MEITYILSTLSIQTFLSLFKKKGGGADEFFNSQIVSCSVDLREKVIALEILSTTLFKLEFVFLERNFCLEFYTSNKQRFSDISLIS